MFLDKEERLKQMEDELLEIYILLEKDTFEDKKQATMRYARLKGIDFATAYIEVKARYKIFTENL